METKEILLELRTKHALSQDELAEKLCGMPLDDSSISKEPDGSFNEEYCKWRYTDGAYVYTSLEELTELPANVCSGFNF